MTASYASAMTLTSDSWLAFVVSLPSSSATPRMRIWRAVKALGCAALRDGAYLLPAAVKQASQLQALADEALQEGGQAWLLHVKVHDMAEQAAYQALFDRTDDYTAWLADLAEARKTLSRLSTAELNRLQRRHAPKANGRTSPTLLTPFSLLASHRHPLGASRGAIVCSSRVAFGLHAATSGWTVWRVLG